MMKRINVPVLASLVFLIGISCYGVFSLYFLNDEWLRLGYVLNKGVFSLVNDHISIIEILSGKERVLGGILNNLFLYFFQDNTVPLALFDILVHLLNSYLVYVLILEITGKKTVAFLTACIFSIPSPAHQALSWFAATIQTIGGMTFVLLSVYYVITGIKRKNIYRSITGWGLAYIAFLFKESCFFVFPLLLILPFIFSQNKLKVRHRYILLFFLVSIFSVYKILAFFGLSTGTSMTRESFLIILRLLTNMVFYPFISLGQFFIPFRFMLRFSVEFGGFYYSFLKGATESNRAASVVVADLLSALASAGILLSVLYLYMQKKQYRKHILIFFLWYILSFIPMAVFLPERNTSYLESRYLYFPYVSVAFLISLILIECKEKIYLLIRNKKVAFIGLFLITVIFLFKQITLMQREIRVNSMYGSDIRHIMELIRSTYPFLPDKPIFFVEGDRNYYFSKINLPFQIGTGYMLSMVFRNRPQIPKEIMVMNYFRKQEDFGYMEFEDKGYGYFGNREELVRFFAKNSGISTNQIVGMYYYGYTDTLVDETEAIRDFVEKERIKQVP